MSTAYNIYCDESCHLENHSQRVMLLGAIWCATEKVPEISSRLKEIKKRHGFTSKFEVKWTKVSASKETLYQDLVDYFFDDDDLHFRVLVIPDKTKIDHSKFPGQDHDTWYYKMYFEMLKMLLQPSSNYRIYVDIKDTKSAEKVRKLHDVLSNNLLDFNRSIVERVQQVRSHEVELLQLTDLLIGAVSYINRGLSDNTGKLAIVDRIKKRSGYSLLKTTLLREEKFNIFQWNPREV